MERDQLWSRLEKASFLTDDEKRAAAGYGPRPQGEGGAALGGSKYAGKFNPYHDELGRFTTADGAGGGAAGNGGGRTLSDANPDNFWTPGSDLAQAQGRGGPRRTVTVGGRSYQANEVEATQLLLAANRASAALDRVRQLDPSWRAAPQLSDPQTAQGAIASNLALAQQAEARLLVIERGGVPLGFNSREDYAEFGRSVRTGLSQAGHANAELYLRGSAVTGYSYRSGEAFDVGRRSDLDVAIVSSDLLREMSARGLELSGGGTRTQAFGGRELGRLGLGDLPRIWSREQRDVTYMVYRSLRDMERRGPFATID